MSSNDEVNHQQELLAIHRRTLAHQLRRAAQYGGEGFAPPEVANGIHEARGSIRQIKAWLRQHSAPVEDQFNDEAARSGGTPARTSSTDRSAFNFHGPVNIGQANMGEQHIGEMRITMGDTIDFSGANISGSILNVKSTLDNVSQSIGALPQTDQATRQALEQLVAQLQGELEKAAQSGHAEDAEKMSSRTKALVDEAGKPRPDKELIEFNAESLKKAATNIATVLPTVLLIATQIVEHIQKLVA